MPEIVMSDSNGLEHRLVAEVGDDLMSLAVRNGVPGIVGECGGNLSCGTCHVWLGSKHLDHAGEISEMEEDMLDMGVSDRRESSRLGCQVTITDELDGLTVDIPPTQP